MHDLREAYFKLRGEAAGLMAVSGEFEAMLWHSLPTGEVRFGADGGKLLVYKTEGQVEACVIATDGTSRTFC